MAHSTVGSLGAAAKPRLRKILDRLEAIRAAKLICGLPIPRYVDERCCAASEHIDNFKEEEMNQVHMAIRSNSRACLLAAYPGCTIFDPVTAFMGNDDDTELTDLISSGGMFVWKEGDAIHLTETAYGDIAELLVDTITGKSEAKTGTPARKRLESVVTRSATDPLQRPSPGGLVGGNQGGARGRGYPRGRSGRGRGSSGAAMQWRGGNGGRWAPLLIVNRGRQSQSSVTVLYNMV